MRKKQFLMRTLALTMAGMMSMSGLPVMAAENNETVNTFQAGEEADGAKKSYVYGTLDLPYADYYYGELNDVIEDSEIQVAAADKAASLRQEGVLDAVSSATTAKWKNFAPTYYSEPNENGGGTINGVKEVVVAVPEELYYQGIGWAGEKEQTNPVLSFVRSLKLLETEEVPAEYKVLNGDGTLTALKDSNPVVAIDTTKEGSKVTATVTTNSKYGHYGISIKENLADGEVSSLPEGRENLEGAIFEATLADGSTKKYALQHLDNLWFKAGEIAFAVKEGFTTHGNTIKYKQFADLQGATITKIKYIVRGGSDVELTTNLKLKALLDETYGITATEGTYEDNAQIKLTPVVPENSNHTLSLVAYGKNVLKAGEDYIYDAESGTLTVKKTNQTGVGTYTLTFTDDTYQDILVSAKYNSALTAEHIKLEDNKIVITDTAASVADYVKAISSIKVDGTALRSVAGVVNEDGTINEDAKVSAKGTETIVFPEKGKEYAIEISADGYPTVSGTVKVQATTEIQPTTAGATTVQPTTAGATTEAATTVQPTTAGATTEAATTVQPTTAAATETQPATQLEATTSVEATTQAEATTAVTTTAATTTEATTQTTENVTVKKGATYTVKKVKYKVTKADLSGKGTVEVIGTTNKKATSVTIPTTVKIEGSKFAVNSIAKNAFKNYSRLKKITIKTKTLKKVGANALKGIHKNAKIKVPASKLKEYTKLLKGKGENVTISK